MQDKFFAEYHNSQGKERVNVGLLQENVLYHRTSWRGDPSAFRTFNHRRQGLPLEQVWQGVVTY